MQSLRFWPVGLFAVAMAYVEAGVVVYLRRALGVADLMRDIPALDPQIALTELGREAATLVMLLAAGWAAGRGWQARSGFALFAFGVWDIFYYVWLRVLIGWPTSLLEPDLLFLIPLPWWGPVLSPLLVAGLCALVGALMVRCDDRGQRVRLRGPEWVALSVSILIVLYVFMADALLMLPATAEDLNQLRPTPFRWTTYLIGLSGMAWAALRLTWPSRAAGARLDSGS